MCTLHFCMFGVNQCVGPSSAHEHVEVSLRALVQCVCAFLLYAANCVNLRFVGVCIVMYCMYVCTVCCLQICLYSCPALPSSPVPSHYSCLLPPPPPAGDQAWQ